jgi:hypothetical protein
MFGTEVVGMSKAHVLCSVYFHLVVKGIRIIKK